MLQGVLREGVPAEIQRSLEGSAAGGAHHGLRFMDEPDVLAQVGRVGVPPPAHAALHPRRGRAQRCQQHHDRTQAPRHRTQPTAPLAILAFKR